MPLAGFWRLSGEVKTSKSTSVDHFMTLQDTVTSTNVECQGKTTLTAAITKVGDIWPGCSCSMLQFPCVVLIVWGAWLTTLQMRSVGQIPAYNKTSQRLLIWIVSGQIALQSLFVIRQGNHYNANPGLINTPPPKGQQDMQNWKMQFFWHYPLLNDTPAGIY